MKRHFIFEPGEWIGNGVVNFTHSPDVLHFRVKWTVHEVEGGAYQGIQLVEVVDGDRMMNIFDVSGIQQDSFRIVLQNELLGTFEGVGIQDQNMVSWEFRARGSFEGFEVYERQADGYSFHAEYLSSDNARTAIHGKIWQKPVEQKKQNETSSQSDAGLA